MHKAKAKAKGSEQGKINKHCLDHLHNADGYLKTRRGILWGRTYTSDGNSPADNDRLTERYANQTKTYDHTDCKNNQHCLDDDTNIYMTAQVVESTWCTWESVCSN